MDKCLKFHLPSGAGGMAAGFTRGSISKKLRQLADDNKIGKNLKTKTVKYDFKVWLEHDIDYTTFFLIWEPDNSWHKPVVINEVYTPPESLWQKE